MSYPRNMAGAVALMASMSLFGLGCAVGADEQDTDADEQTIVADDALKGDEGSKDDSEATGESKDPIWGYGYRGFGYGFPRFGYGFRRFGYGFPHYGYGFRRFGYGYPYAYPYAYPYVYPGYGYGVYGYPYYGGGCGYLGC